MRAAGVRALGEYPLPPAPLVPAREGRPMLDYDMDKRGTLPRYEYLYRRIRDDVLSGELAAGDRLPSKRELARRLGVALVTVESAYGQLEAEGYVTSRPRSGFYVNALPQVTQAMPRPPASEAAAEKDETAADSLLADFSRPATRADSSAANLWEKALRQTFAQEPREALFAAQPAQGTLRLRAAIASYLQRSRGVAVDPANIVVGAGAQAIYAMVAALGGQGAEVAVEDPGYGRVWATYDACGRPVGFVPMDKDGMRVDLLSASDVTVAHVMPSHQFPTGRVMSAARRFELLGWAAAAERYIVEDDYDCEFRMAGRPVPPLLAADTASRVIYVNTFSKSLSSALRLAYLVLPTDLMRLWHERLGFLACTVSVVDQVALARLLESGDYDRHVARFRTQQRRLRDDLLAVLCATAAGDALGFEETDSGLHFVLAAEVVGDPAEAERRIAREALAGGVRLAPLSSYAHDPANATPRDGRARFVMQYDGLDPALVPQVAEALAAAVAHGRVAHT